MLVDIVNALKENVESIECPDDHRVSYFLEGGFVAKREVKEEDGRQVLIRSLEFNGRIKAFIYNPSHDEIIDAWQYGHKEMVESVRTNLENLMPSHGHYVCEFNTDNSGMKILVQDGPVGVKWEIDVVKTRHGAPDEEIYKI
ncbi:MAG: hypothetical protein GY861_10740 [bacterium]|nr:hypothetical protein [bacterium]